jgi:peroxiredoxin
MDLQNISGKSGLNFRIGVTLVLFFASLLLYSCSGTGSNFTITGIMDNADGKKLYLYELSTYDLIPADSLTIGENGKFSFQGEIDRIRFMSLRHNQLNHLTLIVSPGEHIEITADLENLQNSARITGSPESELAVKLNKKMHSTILKLDSLSSSYHEGLNEPGTDIDLLREQIKDRFEEIAEVQRQYTIDFVSRNPSSLASLMALYHQIDPSTFVLGREDDFRYYALVDSMLISKYPDLDYTLTLNENVREMKSRIAQRKQRENLLRAGALAPEISLPDPRGDTITLSSLRGNYVLLDFWATWCAPCLEENPYLVETYNKYNSKGFEIYQVSLDRSREHWESGIKEAGLERWTHVSDLQFWSSIVVPLYQIEGIPANFLLDPDGRIIARNLRGEALGDALTEFFD